MLGGSVVVELQLLPIVPGHSSLLNVNTGQGIGTVSAVVARECCSHHHQRCSFCFLQLICEYFCKSWIQVGPESQLPFVMDCEYVIEKTMHAFLGEATNQA